ncbi:Gfo/Idh/MocA family protein [Alicyclobacillus fastidiosus]|uniref:Gfo/Idh/MocA family oxidoreductase n=1 Tax=Alicyclobacillus fastidiosus TaxID=392011 RepID=A0ABV5AFG9_9BACL|nr:Gfo/Idh/MocA family oxidoreductase [Alicyclobacillus fastidiosus]WEH09822.1 Gfo/Idh/MocA family oxidoreductase [Alicyclobacillus fastidiosus]
MKVAILSFAHMHALSYADAVQQSGVDLVISDFDEARGREMASRFNTPYVKDYQEVLADPDIEAVIVCSENASHAQLVIDAAEAGKHVLCEKPLATTVADARRMIEACERAGVKLQTAFPIRYSTPVQRLKRLIESGKVGRILAMSGTNRGQNPGGWFVDPALSGGGAVFDHTVHILDIMRWYTGSEVSEVYAEVDSRFGERGIDDCGLLTLTFANGVIATHDPSWSRPKSFPTWGDVTLRVIGTGGVVSVDALAQNLVHYDDTDLRARRVPWGDDADLHMVQSFLDCVRYDTQPLATGVDGLKAVEVALAAYESARTKRPVQLPTC